MPAPDNIKTALMKRRPERVNITFSDGDRIRAATLLEILDDGIVYQSPPGGWAVVPYTALHLISEVVDG